MVRASVVAKPVARMGLLGAMATVLIAASCNKDLWDVGHMHGDRLRADRPECPVMWDTIPLAFSPKEVDSLLKVYPREFPNAIRRVGSGADRHLVFTPKGIVNPLDGSTTQDGDLPLSGPITNIPEFHDCQRFLSEDGSRFDSLFAIFASFKLDATMASLNWTTIVAWTGGPTAFGTVTPTGIVTGVAPGELLITAVDNNGNAIGPFPVMVTTSGASTSASVAVGPGAPPATILVGDERQLVYQGGPNTASTLAAATIYSYGYGYAPLGIGRNFSCLYVYFTAEGTLRAKMIPVGSLDQYEHACLTAVDPNQATGTELEVVRSVANLGPGQSQAGQYPSVARWDSDPESGKPYIGIRCLDAWCEIHDPSVSLSESYTASSAAPIGEKRVIQIKGWYDEQLLAAPGAGGPNNLRPSGLRGTVIPAPALDAVSQQSLSPTVGANGIATPTWTLVAYVALRDIANDADARDHYHTKLGLEIAPVGALSTLNQMHYCYGTRKDCEVPNGSAQCDAWWEWFVEIKRVWVKIVAPTGTSKYLCVTRRGHPSFAGHVPPTSRWRWILSDDTIWTACVQGCCQTETGS